MMKRVLVVNLWLGLFVGIQSWEAGLDPKHENLRNYFMKGITGIGEHVIRILAFGDSLTEGYLNGGSNYHPYTMQLERLLNEHAHRSVRFQLINEGVSGECAFVEMRTRLPVVLDSYLVPFSLAIVLGGTNDLRRLDCVKKVNVAYEVIALHSKLHERGIKTVVVTIPESDNNNVKSPLKHFDPEKANKVRLSVNKRLRVFAAKNANNTILCDLARFYPMHALNDELKKKYWSDKVHPTAYGYDRIGHIVFRFIRRLFGV